MDLIKSLFQIAGDVFNFDKNSASKSPDSKKASGSIESKIPRKEDSFLPDNPQELYRWMHQLDIAIARRLRDLSHSINKELLKVGFIDTLIPLNLLEAVLLGQLQTEASPSNILRLRIPVQSNSYSQDVDMECILVRLSELEFDNPQLRKCKVHLQKQSNLLLKMIKQQRHWQKRSLVQEVQQNWWQDIQYG